MNPNQFAAIMPYISADLVEMIAEKENISENAAITKLFNSELYAILEQEDTKVWHYSTHMLYSLLEQERYIYPVKGRGNFVSDTTLLVEQTKKTLLENVSRLIANGKELGVKRAEFTQLVDRIYRKEDSHDRVKNA